MSREVLGIDIGNVIIDGANDTFFGPQYLQVPAVPGAVQTIRHLVAGRFAGGRLHLVSKCGMRIQGNTREWLKETQFFESTFVPQENLHFCLKRDGKAPICKELGITHFIDDRLEVLSHMVSIVPNLYLFRPREKDLQKDLRRFGEYLPKVTVVQSWTEIQEMLR